MNRRQLLTSQPLATVAAVAALVAPLTIPGVSATSIEQVPAALLALYRSSDVTGDDSGMWVCTGDAKVAYWVDFELQRVTWSYSYETGATSSTDTDEVAQDVSGNARVIYHTDGTWSLVNE